MIAEIINGILEIYPKSKTEDYALQKWYEDNVNSCTRATKGENMALHSYRKYKRSILNKIRL